MRGLGLFLGWFRQQASGGSTPSAPVNTVAPVVTGTGYVGYTLTTTNGTWTGSPAPTFTYQWRRNGVNIGGATSSTYVVTLTDEGVPVDCVVTATNGSGSANATSNSIEQWVPTDAGIVSGWWDALSPSTITIATGVSLWTNRGSTANLNVEQSVGGNQPAYSATAWDGVRPAITFDGTDDRLRNTAASVFMQNVGGGTTVAAAEPTSLASADRAILSASIGGGDANARQTIRSNLSLSQWVIGARRLDADATLGIANGPTSALTTRIIGGQTDHTNDRARPVVDGTASAWTTPYKGAGNTSNTASDRVALGSNSAANANFWQGKIAEVIHYNSVLPDEDLNKLNGYLAWRWGVTANLPGGHPYKSSPPLPDIILRSDGVSAFRRPDATSRYVRP